VLGASHRLPALTRVKQNRVKQNRLGTGSVVAVEWVNRYPPWANVHLRESGTQVTPVRRGVEAMT